MTTCIIGVTVHKFTKNAGANNVFKKSKTCKVNYYFVSSINPCNRLLAYKK